MCNCVEKLFFVFLFFFSFIVYLANAFLFGCAHVLFILQLQGQTDGFLHHLIEDVKQVNRNYVITYQMVMFADQERERFKLNFKKHYLFSSLVLLIFKTCLLLVPLLNVCVSRLLYPEATASLSLMWAW